MTLSTPILILLAAFVAVYFQASFDTARNLLGAQIDLLPALVVYAALTYEIEFVAILAVCGGLWFDSLSANPLGVSILPLFVIGLLIYRYRTLLLREHIYAQFVLGLGASACAPIFGLLTLFSMDANPMVGWGSLWQWIVMTLLGALLTPVCFQVFDRINRALNYQRVSETSFRSDREIKRGRF